MKPELGEKILEIVKSNISVRCMTMQQGTIADTTLIIALSSAKNKDEKRDLEMNQTKKGNQ